jgi:hypothetical protein
MPKLVTKAHIMKWRSLYYEGKDYREIGRITGWQARTVKKYLESEIRSSEAQEIRRELFKERLGKHWDMLLYGVLERLDAVRPQSQSELLPWVGTVGASETSTNGMRLRRDEQWELTVHLEARDIPEWSLLREHIPRDDLWSTVELLEEAVGNDLQARRDLYVIVERMLTRQLNVAVVERLEEEPGLTRGLLLLVLGTVISRALGSTGMDILPDEIEEDHSGIISVQAIQQAAYGKGLKGRLAEVVRKIIAKSPEWPEMASWLKRYARVQEAYQELKRSIGHLRLLPYLPGVCVVCGRFEV